MGERSVVLMKKWLSLLLTLCIVLSGLACCALGEADGTITLTILHTNDTHGSGISPPPRA